MRIFVQTDFVITLYQVVIAPVKSTTFQDMFEFIARTGELALVPGTFAYRWRRWKSAERIEADKPDMLLAVTPPHPVRITECLSTPQTEFEVIAIYAINFNELERTGYHS